MDKTNAMRILDEKGIKYDIHLYDEEETDGQKVAALVNLEPERVFKTLVTVGSDRKNYVFVIPVVCTLDLKKAARAAKIKNVEMLKQKELFPLTGYVHGGCSPVGMKKKFPTFFDETAMLYDKIAVSGGRRGMQIEISAEGLLSAVDGECVDLTQ